jgi:type I restriction enzyme, S subunit
MKLNKENWEKTKFQDVVLNINKSIKDPLAIGINKSIGLENIIPNNMKVQSFVDIEKEGTKFSKLFKKGQFLFGSRRAYLRQMALAEFDGICTANIMVFDVKDSKKMLHDYLSMIIQSNLFVDYASGTSVGSLFPNAKWSSLANFTFLLPPLEEQKQIAALFQSIDTATQQVDGQEKNLKALQKSLADGLLKPEPEFGNLLNKTNCTSTTFGEIAECDKKYPEHEKEVERFVGLEWIEADNFQLQGYGLVANGTTFTKRFAKGDVLFGKRRAYLKKVAIADFDGICSGDILVIRAKAKKMMQELLPFYISADAFINHAVSTSAGSLSPRTKWKDLAELEVPIPDLKTQEKVLEIFTQLQSTLKQLKQQKTTLQNLKQKLLSEILG